MSLVTPVTDLFLLKMSFLMSVDLYMIMYILQQIIHMNDIDLFCKFTNPFSSTFQTSLDPGMNHKMYS